MNQIHKHDTLGEYSYTDTTSTYNGTRRLKGQVNIKGIPVDVDYGDQKLDVITKIDPKTIGFEYSLNGEGKTFTDNKFKEVVRLYSDKMSEKVTDIKKKSEENDKERDSKGFIFKALSGQIGNQQHRGSAFARSDLGKATSAIAGLSSLLASPLIGVTYGLLTNPRAFLFKPGEAIGSYMYAGLDYSVSLFMNPILGDPLPSVVSSHGGVYIYNSYNANHGIFELTSQFTHATTRGPYVSLRTGVSTVTINHETAHVQQWLNGNEGYGSGFGDPTEHLADLISGTNSYLTWEILFANGLLGKDDYRSILAYNLYESIISGDELGILIWERMLNNDGRLR